MKISFENFRQTKDLQNAKLFTLANDNGMSAKIINYSGNIGFDKVIWDTEISKKENDVSLKLKYLSKDGEEGYPGNLLVSVKFILTNKDEIIIEYNATTDKFTPVCLTNHTYFNLTADFKNNILDHELWLNSNKFLPINDKAIPLGELNSVMETPFDFTKSKKIGDRINEQNEQLQNGNGYDHCMIFNDYDEFLKLQATLYDEESGRLMEMFTTKPATQLYTANKLINQRLLL